MFNGDWRTRVNAGCFVQMSRLVALCVVMVMCLASINALKCNFGLEDNYKEMSSIVR